MSHAAPKVTKVNDPAAKANPTMYQIPVNRTSLRTAPAIGAARNGRPLLGRTTPGRQSQRTVSHGRRPAGILAAAASAGGSPRGARTGVGAGPGTAFSGGPP